MDKVEQVLEKIHKQVSNQAENEKYVGVNEVAEHLSVTVMAVYKMAQRNQIPYRRFGGRLRFKLSQIDSP